MIGRNRVVITGVGVLAANGIGKEAFWNSLLAGESGIGPITQFDTSDIPWKIAGEINDFNPLDFIDPKYKPKRQSRNTQLAAAATLMAMNDAGIKASELNLEGPLKIILGISLGGLDLVEQHTRRMIEKGLNKGLPTVSACVHIIAASFISSILDVPTELAVLSNSCTGGLDAIAAGAAAIRRGETEVVIAGATDAVIVPSVVTGLGFAGMLATDIESPETASRPFDLQRTGGIVSDGSGVVILENYEHALARGAIPYAEILGHGAASSVNTLVSAGLETSITKAMGNSGCHPHDISYISAHGSSDPELDIAETIAIKNMFGELAYKIPISSIKGCTGNPLAAGGALQVIATSLMMHHSIIAPTANYKFSDPDCDLDYVPNELRKAAIGTALINSHGTGGVNSSLIMRKV